MSDAASLQNLHDIVMPGPVGWWPPAPGWYAVAAIAAVVLLVFGWRRWRRWRQNRYRGEALRELERIRRSGLGADLREVPKLLKRAALSAWPRAEVAGLVGSDWHRFLDATAGTDRFCSGMGELLDVLAYAGGPEPPVSAAEAAALLEASEHWLKRHSVPPEDD